MSALLQLLPYIFSLGISTGVSLYAWQQKHVNGARLFALYAFGQVWWTFGYILELNAKSLDGKIFWDDFQFFGTFLVGAALLMFALEYTHRPLARSRRLQMGLVITTILLQVVVYTDPWHQLVRPTASLIKEPPFDELYYEFTTFVIVASLYGYLLMVGSLWLLIREFRRVQPAYKAQMATILGGVCAVVVAISLPFFGISFGGQRDVSPFAFAAGNVVIAWGLFRYNLFNLVPVARDTVIENMVNAVITIDPQHRIVDLNPAAARLVTNTPKIGQPFDLYFPQYVAFIEQHSGAAHIQQEVTTANGYAELSLSSIQDQQGKTVGKLLTITDITERVKARQEVERLYAEQLKLVEELKALDAMKSQFLASMSHELRTPLNAILNFTEFILLGMLGPTTDKQRDALEKTLSSGKHLLALINDVLDMTKIQSGMMKLFVEDQIDLHKEISAAAAPMESLLKDKRVRFVQDIDTDLPLLAGDKRRIRQILLNLLSNAAKFTEEGSITLAAKQQGDNILFMVSDTGPGIPAEDHDLIFEPFRQTEAGIQHTGGTGLGLPISRKLAEAHGGRLWIESAAGEGATFFVTLPVQSKELLALIKIPEGAKHV